MNCPPTHLYLPAITSNECSSAIGVISYRSCAELLVVNSIVFVIRTVADILCVGTSVVRIHKLRGLGEGGGRRGRGVDQIPGLSRGGIRHSDMNKFKQLSFCVHSFLSVQSCQVSSCLDQ